MRHNQFGLKSSVDQKDVTLKAVRRSVADCDMPDLHYICVGGLCVRLCKISRSVRKMKNCSCEYTNQPGGCADPSTVFGALQSHSAPAASRIVCGSMRAVATRAGFLVANWRRNPLARPKRDSNNDSEHVSFRIIIRIRRFLLVWGTFLIKLRPQSPPS